KNKSIKSAWTDALGLNRTISTIGYEEYENSTTLARLLCGKPSTKPPIWRTQNIRSNSPIYYMRPVVRDDFETKTYSRLKKTNLGFKMFDPLESPSFVLPRAVDEISASAGVVLHLVGEVYENATEHNYLNAFVLGLAHASRKIVLCLQHGTSPVPLDYRDLVSSWSDISDIQKYISDFALEVNSEVRSDKNEAKPRDRSFLESVSLGASAAENELQDLKHYFLETHEYQRCLRGEVQVVHGRKGSGKTAVFAQVRDKIRRDRKNVVLDLQPEGYQLLKLKDVVLTQLPGGTREHSIVAFWEYLLYLEIANKILQKDKHTYRNDHEIYDQYRDLEKEYSGPHYISAGDFAERLSRLIVAIQERFESINKKELAEATSKGFLDSDQLTQFLYSHDFSILRDKVMDYLELKQSLWILFDNLDKGWPAQGLTSDDAMMIRCLIEAINRMSLRLKKSGIRGGGIVFIRSDVFDLVINNTSDRGKLPAASIDWVDKEQLRELLRKRLIYFTGDHFSTDCDFKDVWTSVCVSHIDGEDTSSYMIDRSIMRPRSLIDLFQRCLSHAVNMGKTQIDEDDIRHGEEMYSSDLVRDIGFEIRDVFSDVEDILYCFIGSSQWINENDFAKLIQPISISEDARPKAVEYLLRSGFLGVVDIDKEEERYIYDFAYDYRRLAGWVNRLGAKDQVFCINPAFWKGLEISSFK
ncbi:MAG: hypothetical protein NXI14_10985, partial [bacterium]|nr:hypothetical protein [bacterium]